MRRDKAFGRAATALSALWFTKHTFVGGPQVAVPPIAWDIADVVRVTGWMVRYTLACVLALVVLLFGRATSRRLPDMMNAATALAGPIALGVIASAFGNGVGVMIIPHGFLFLPVAIFGWLAWRGIWTAPKRA